MLNFMNSDTQLERSQEDGIELLPDEKPIYDRMKQLYKKADASGVVHARDAMRVGVALIEEREFLAGHDLWDLSQGSRVNPVTMEPREGGGRKLFHGGDTDPEATLVSRMRAAEIPKQRGQRWMRAAENVIRALAEPRPGGHMPLELEHGGKLVFLSEALSLADDESDSPALAFQRAVFMFLEDHSLRDAIAGKMDAGAVALNGLMSPHSGGGGDRKDYANFTLRKLKHLNTFFGVWETMPERQRTEIKSEFEAAICGEEFKLRGRTQHDDLRAPVKFEPWPDDVCEVVMEAIKLRRKNK
jgi:hypothetical protein